LKNKAMLAFAAIVLCAGSARPAAGQGDKPYLITVSAGYSRMLEATQGIEVRRIRVTGVADPGGSFTASAGMYYMVMPELAAGVEVSWLGLGTTDSRGTEDRFSCLPITGQLIYFIPTRPALTPFVTGGAGYYRSSLDGDFEESTITVVGNGYGFNIGGGLKIAVSASYGIGFDFRYHMAVDPSLVEDVGDGQIKIDSHNWNMFTVGCRVFF
jgi:hypothetical protein